MSSDIDEMNIPGARSWVVHPDLKKPPKPGIIDTPAREPEQRLDEIVSLCDAIALHIVGSELITLREIRPSTFISKGKLEELAITIKAEQIELLVFDGQLTPVQQRELEKALKCKVIDRTALILEIFGERAHTKEGVLQVELAALNYQKSRLVRSWTHLERQRGGLGFIGGPGETQIESDRRVINDRIAKIRKSLETVTKTRDLQRKNRQKVPYPVVALVGYTNAGKSTLFNRLTKADVFAKDLLFATLDPTMREIQLPSSRKIILSDTVGFISDLPTELIAAFRATLEEVAQADLILHIRDIARADSDAQKEDVLEVLNSLVSMQELEEKLLEVGNKCDLIGDDIAPAHGQFLSISAHTGEGIEALLEQVDHFFAKQAHSITATLNPATDGKLLAWLYAHGEHVEVEEDNNQLNVTANLDDRHYNMWMKLFGR